MISVIVCTTARRSLKRTVSSVLRNSYQNFEILIVYDGSVDFQFKHKKIREFRSVTRGLSNARNFAVRQSRGSIVAFTDDDCIVPENWLSNIAAAFGAHREISAVFGNVLPYQPDRHVHEHCPCLIDVQRRKITDPGYHGDMIGFGNNMAFRTRLFARYGGFKSWLGLGSVGGSAEDAEFSLRLIVTGQIILHEPRITVRHNRWVSAREYEGLLLGYELGEIICYGYFWMQGHAFARRIVSADIRTIVDRGKTGLMQAFGRDPGASRGPGILRALRSFGIAVYGLCIAGVFAFTDPTA